MAQRANELVVDETITIAAPSDRVWEALIDPAVRGQWWGYLDLDPRVGGRFEERWTDPDGNPVRTQGQVLELIEHQLLRLSWADHDWTQATEVHVRLQDADHRTVVRVRHTGWEDLSDGATLAAEHRNGWRMHLQNLRRQLEEGAAR